MKVDSGILLVTSQSLLQALKKILPSWEIAVDRLEIDTCVPPGMEFHSFGIPEENTAIEFLTPKGER